MTHFYVKSIKLKKSQPDSNSTEHTRSLSNQLAPMKLNGCDIFSCWLKASQRQRMTNRHTHTQRNAETYACKRYTYKEAKWKNRLRKLASSCIREVEREGGQKKTDSVRYVTSVSLLCGFSEFPIIINKAIKCLMNTNMLQFSFSTKISAYIQIKCEMICQSLVTMATQGNLTNEWVYVSAVSARDYLELKPLIDHNRKFISNYFDK